VPAPNEQRRSLLTDTAIALLAEAGVHGLTHRAVERRAGLPDGTASNYFRSREALLVATAERVGQLHRADMDAAAAAWSGANDGPPGDQYSHRRRPAAAVSVEAQTVELITASLLAAATRHRPRYLAVFELRMESVRRPALAEALAAVVTTSFQFTAGHHAALGLDIPPERIPLLITFYGGVLFTLVTEPSAAISEPAVRALVAALVHGALDVARS
jgi:AcrR family transcriptional regulator